MDKENKKVRVAVLLEYMGLGIYTLIWGIIAYSTFHQLIPKGDFIMRFVVDYVVVMAFLKVITCIFCVLVMIKQDSDFFKSLAIFFIVVTRLIDAGPTILYMYKGLFHDDPMAFLFLIPKGMDTFVFWVLTGLNGTVYPCYFCFKPDKNVLDEEEDINIINASFD